MDWLRWYHGTYSDPKFRVVARKAGATIPEVVAVWAAVLEAASASDERGTPGTLDLEAIDAALDMPDGKAAAIHDAMIAKRLIDGSTGAVAAWEKRQPKREDPTAADRMRKHRDAKRQRNQDVTRSGDAPLRDVTHGYDRSEKNRTEKNEEVHTHTAREGGSESGDLGYGMDHDPHPPPRIVPSVAVVGPKRAPIAPDFAPDAANRARAGAYGLDLARELEEFSAHARDNGRDSADWQAAFARWLNKSATMAQNRARTGPPRAAPGGARFAAERTEDAIQNMLREAAEHDAEARRA